MQESYLFSNEGTLSSHQIEFLMDIYENELLNLPYTSVTTTRHSKLLIKSGLLSVQIKNINGRQLMIYMITDKGIDFLKHCK